MSKKITIIIITALVVWLSFFIYESMEEQRLTTFPEAPLEEKLGKDPLNATYLIEKDKITLIDGKAEKEIAPGSASKIRINVFDGWSTKGDINNDGLEDTVVLLTYNGGGSGTFYYVALALQQEQGYLGTNTVFIGDRISPQTTEVRNREVIINYADRYPWESFSVSPSVGISKYLIYENGELKERQNEVLSQEVAETLIVNNLGGCEANECSDFKISILGGNQGPLYIQAIYNGMKDDSVKARKIITSVHYIEGEWKLSGELKREYICQLDRGQQEFSSELCL